MIKPVPIKAIALILLFLLPIVSCKKSNSNEDETPEIIHLNPGTMGYAPFEVVQIPLQEVAIAQQEINTTINGKPLKIAIIDNNAHFIMPELDEGQYTVKFKATRDFEFSIFVRKASDQLTAEEYHTQYAQGFVNVMYGIEQRSKDASLGTAEKAALTADKQRFAALFDEYEKAYATLNADEKMAFAHTMAGNYSWVSFLVNSTQGITKNTVKIQELTKAPMATDIFDYEAQQQYAITKWLQSSRILRDNITKLSAMILLVPVTGAIPIIGTLGTGIAIGYLITEVAASLSINLADLSALLDITFAPYDDLTLDDAASKVYDHAEERVLSVQARFRNLLSSDQSGSEITGTLKNFLTDLLDFRSTVTKILDKMPARFKPTVLIASLKSSTNAVKRQVNGAYLSITNISNSQVKVAFSKLTDGTFKILPTVTGTTDQQVSFDVTYSNPNFSSKQIKKTISTTVKYAIDSTNHYKQLVLGNWRVTNVESGEAYDMVVLADGKAQYLHQGATYNATWQISKVGKKYYFREFNFWHPGYNQFRVFNAGFADEGLRTPLTGFMHYNDLGGGKGPGPAIRYQKK
nr:hypothetical protein [uncultured Mucilaginibacter sp.]